MYPRNVNRGYKIKKMDMLLTDGTPVVPRNHDKSVIACHMGAGP